MYLVWGKRHQEFKGELGRKRWKGLEVSEGRNVIISKKKAFEKNQT